MQHYTVALSLLSLSLGLASWLSRRNGDEKRDTMALLSVTLITVAATVVSFFL
jgi:hypothetical protein